jgi:ATP-dependent helicase/DNAse subunit B
MLSSLAEREVFSAGELETYLSCPHAWLHVYVLSPRSLDREIDKAEAGRLLHRALKEAYECLPDRLGVSRLGPATLPAAYALLDEVLERLFERAYEPHDLIEAEELRGVRRTARASLARDACSLTGFSPLHVEWSFGKGDGDGPEDLGGFFLRGRIDRIDRSDDGIVVIDYKSSGGPRSDRFAEDGLLQLPLYGLVAARRLGLPLLGGLYRNVKEDRTRGFFIEGAVPDPGPGSGRSGLDAAALDAVVADAVERARSAVEGIRSGDIEPVTRPVGRCRYCRVASACGVDRS